MLVLMGRPSKGERAVITAKPNIELAEIVRRNATLLDMSYGDYLVALAAHALGLPEHAPKPGRALEALEALAFDEGEAPVEPATVAPITALQTPKERRAKIAS